MIHMAKKRCPSAHFHCGDMSRALPQGPYDTIIIPYNTLNLLKKPAKNLGMFLSLS